MHTHKKHVCVCVCVGLKRIFRSVYLLTFVSVLKIMPKCYVELLIYFILHMHVIYFVFLYAFFTAHWPISLSQSEIVRYYR